MKHRLHKALPLTVLAQRVHHRYRERLSFLGAKEQVVQMLEFSAANERAVVSLRDMRRALADAAGQLTAPLVILAPDITIEAHHHVDMLGLPVVSLQSSGNWTEDSRRLICGLLSAHSGKAALDALVAAIQADALSSSSPSNSPEPPESAV